MTGKRNYAGGVELARILAGQDHAPVVYFVRMGENVKIGTSTNLKARLRSFYLSLDDVLVVVPGGKETEDAYHKQFAANQVRDDARQELFRIDGRLLFFLGQWRGTAISAGTVGLPLSLTPRIEVGNFLDLDDELRELEGGGRGEWDEERAADLVARLTYLSETADDDFPWRGHAWMYAYYWNATSEQAQAEADEAREEVLAANPPPRWWEPWKIGDREALVAAACSRIEEHARRAAVLRDLFASALQPYELGKQKGRSR